MSSSGLNPVSLRASEMSAAISAPMNYRQSVTAALVFRRLSKAVLSEVEVSKTEDISTGLMSSITKGQQNP